MIILNQDCTRCNQPIDLAECYPVDSNRYISVQQIEDGYTTYTIYDQTANTVLQPDKWHSQYSLKNIDGSTFYLSSKQIVRALYDSEWCVDTIPDLPFEGLDIHHIASIHDNQAWNLSAMPKAEHIKLHQRLNKAGIVGLKEPLEI